MRRRARQLSVVRKPISDRNYSFPSPSFLSVKRNEAKRPPLYPFSANFKLHALDPRGFRLLPARPGKKYLGLIIKCIAIDLQVYRDKSAVPMHNAVSLRSISTKKFDRCSEHRTADSRYASSTSICASDEKEKKNDLVRKRKILEREEKNISRSTKFTTCPIENFMYCGDCFVRYGKRFFTGVCLNKEFK